MQLKSQKIELKDSLNMICTKRQKEMKKQGGKKKGQKERKVTLTDMEGRYN